MVSSFRCLLSLVLCVGCYRSHERELLPSADAGRDGALRDARVGDGGRDAGTDGAADAAQDAAPDGNVVDASCDAVEPPCSGGYVLRGSALDITGELGAAPVWHLETGGWRAWAPRFDATGRLVGERVYTFDEHFTRLDLTGSVAGIPVVIDGSELALSPGFYDEATDRVLMFLAPTLGETATHAMLFDSAGNVVTPATPLPPGDRFGTGMARFGVVSVFRVSTGCPSSAAIYQIPESNLADVTRSPTFPFLGFPVWRCDHWTMAGPAGCDSGPLALRDVTSDGTLSPVREVSGLPSIPGTSVTADSWDLQLFPSGHAAAYARALIGAGPDHQLWLVFVDTERAVTVTPPVLVGTTRSPDFRPVFFGIGDEGERVVGAAYLELVGGPMFPLQRSWFLRIDRTSATILQRTLITSGTWSPGAGLRSMLYRDGRWIVSWSAGGRLLIDELVCDP